MADENRTFPRIVPIALSNENTGWVAKELIRRRDNFFGKGASPRATWVRAVSNAGKSTGTGVASIRNDVNIIVGGLLRQDGATRGDFESIYKKPGNREQQFRPMSGIDSISVVNKGEYQSLRKITITWTVGSAEELDELAPYWLSPGVSVWLEWGWTEIGKNSSNLNSPDFGTDQYIETLRSYYNDPKLIYNNIVQASEGNHDAYVGIITNYSWNLNDDGTFACTTELTSLGQTFLVTDNEKSGGVIKSDFKSQDDILERKGSIRKFVEDMTDDNLRGLPRSHITGKADEGKRYLDTKDIFYLQDGAYKLFEWVWPDNTYVTWRFIEQAIINETAGFVFSDKNVAVTGFNSENIRISNDPILYSTDEETLLIVRSGVDQALVFDVPNTNSRAGFLSNLYVNVDLVQKVFVDESDTVEEAVKRLLNEMTKAAGDIWNFKIQENPLNPSELQVIDMNYVDPNDLDEVQSAAIGNSENESDRIFSFGGAYSGKSIISSISFQSKLTDQIAYKHFIARNSAEENVTANEDTNAGVPYMFRPYRDRLFDGLRTPPERDYEFDTDDERDARKEEEEEKAEKLQEKYEKMQALINNITSDVSEGGFQSGIVFYDEDGKELLVEYLNRPIGKFKEDGSGKLIPEFTENKTRYVPIYPLEITVGVDGMSGFIPGMCFTLESLPAMYKDNGVFQIVEVSHELSADEWTTSLRCFFRVIRTDDAVQQKSRD